MLRRLIVAAFVVAGMASFAFAQFEDPIENTVTSVAATAVGTCATGGEMLLDLNGLVRCPDLTTTDPSDVIVRSGSCYELDATCTASDLHIAAGIDTHQFTGVDFDAGLCAGDAIVVALVDKTGASSNCTCTEGVGWSCATSDAVCAANLATCLTACAGISASSSADVVGVRPDASTLDITLTGSAGCMTAANGTPGFTYFWNNIRPGVNNNYSNGDSTSRWSSMATTTLTVAGSISNPLGDTTVSDAFIASSTIDARGAVSNSTNNLFLTDNVELSGNSLIGAGFEMSAMTSQTLSTGGTTVSGRVITNDGATARANLTFDDAPSGRSYRWEFVVLDTDGIKLIASTGDTITTSNGVGASDGYICSTAIGASATCLGIADNRWLCRTVGTWSIDADCP